ncbi:MAG: ComEC/Rec2 family competence protein [Acidimicrobiia bacterium]
MSDRWAVALAAATALGAWLSWPLPRWAGAVVAVAALAARRPALLCVGAALFASALGARAWAGLDPPPPGTPAAGRAVLVTDPRRVDGAVRVELRLDGRRVEAWARGPAASALRPRLAGETVEVRGRLSPVPSRARPYLARRHVAARLSLAAVGGWTPGGPLARVANDVRRTLVRGTSSFRPDHRALFTGLVLGDDRDQDAASVDDFRAAGLSHLLAVSGQNVAFVLALAAPGLRLLGLRGRLVAALAVVAAFGALTRWEPSVLRASAMAAVALLAATAGRPASTARALALGVSGLLLVDPLLVGSVGFLLSCGACAGIAGLAGPLGRRLPMPVAVTVAAQVGVAPVLVPLFGGIPVASLPANLLAVPAAAPVTVWGLAAGLPAGLAGEPLAGVVHVPTRLLVGWVAGVARWGAALPLGELGGPAVAALAALGLAAVVARRARAPAAAAALAVCLWPAVTPPAPASGRLLTADARLWRSGPATVLVVGRPRPGPLLAALREAGVRGVSVVVVTSPSSGAVGSLAPVLARHPAGLVLTPSGAPVGTTVTAGRLVVRVTAASPRLAVEVGPCTFPPCSSASVPAPSTSAPGRSRPAWSTRPATPWRAGRPGWWPTGPTPWWWRRVIGNWRSRPRWRRPWTWRSGWRPPTPAGPPPPSPPAPPWPRTAPARPGPTGWRRPPRRERRWCSHRPRHRLRCRPGEPVATPSDDRPRPHRPRRRRRRGGPVTVPTGVERPPPPGPLPGRRPTWWAPSPPRGRRAPPGRGRPASPGSASPSTPAGVGRRPRPPPSCGARAGWPPSATRWWST